MKRALIRLATTATGFCVLIGGALVLPADAATPPVFRGEPIVVPTPDQLSDGGDSALSLWLREYVAQLTASMSSLGVADGHNVAGADAEFAVVFAAPLAAAEYVLAGR